jgi:hypothetical protein
VGAVGAGETGCVEGGGDERDELGSEPRLRRCVNEYCSDACGAALPPACCKFYV